jgi:hypothetical protein
LFKEAVFREGLLEVIPPGSQVRVSVRLDVRVDVRFGGEVVWITTRVERVRVLVHSNIIHPHRRGEGQVFEVDMAEVGRHTQVGYDVHRLLWNRSPTNFNPGVWTHPCLFERPSQFTTGYPGDILNKVLNFGII